MKKEYIFDEWKPNIPLLMIAFVFYIFTMGFSSNIGVILITITMLLFGWSFSFSRRIK